MGIYVMRISLIKASMLDTTLTSYQNFSRDQCPAENIKPCKLKTLKHLAKNKNII